MATTVTAHDDLGPDEVVEIHGGLSNHRACCWRMPGWNVRPVSDDEPDAPYRGEATGRLMSGRITHYAAGAARGLAVGQVGHLVASWPTYDVAALGAVALATAGGELSQDVDQFKWFRRLDRWTPDELLGGGGPFQHRGITHWIGWPPIMAAAWVFVMWRWPETARFWWAGWGVVIGWTSHVIMDALYGHEVHTPEGVLIVRKGVPTVLWYRHRFGVWTSSGPGSAAAGWVLGALAVVQACAVLGVLGQIVTLMEGLILGLTHTHPGVS